jgi:hypothetical protein
MSVVGRYMIGMLVLYVLLPPFSWAEEVEKVEEHRFKIPTDGQVIVEADEGDIFIQAWDKGEVYLKVTKRAWGRTRKEAKERLDRIHLDIRQVNERLVIKEQDRFMDNEFNFFDLFDKEFWQGEYKQGAHMNFELMVPRQVKLKLKSDEGNVEVTGTRGELIIYVDEGDVNLSELVSTDLQVSVDEGDVKIVDFHGGQQGFWKIDTDEGRIMAKNGDLTELELNSDEGDLILRNVRITRYWLSTDEGDIDVDFVPQENGNYRMETDEGDLDVAVPQNSQLSIRMQTMEGIIHTDFDMNVRQRGDGAILEGTMGERISQLKAYTDEGDIFLHQRH